MEGDETMKYTELDKRGKRDAMHTVVNNSMFANYTEEELVEMIRDFAEICGGLCGTEFEIIVRKRDSKTHKLDIQQYVGKIQKVAGDCNRLTDEAVETIVALYKDGYSKNAIATSLGLSRNTVAKYLKDNEK
mgnify:CR=1 FL=1